MVWFPRISATACGVLLATEQRPVVLAYVRYDDSLDQVMEALWQIRLAFGDDVALRLLDAEGDRDLGTQLRLSEAPFFILYHLGRELLRLPGGVGSQALFTSILDRFFTENS